MKLSKYKTKWKHCFTIRELAKFAVRLCVLTPSLWRATAGVLQLWVSDCCSGIVHADCCLMRKNKQYEQLWKICNAATFGAAFCAFNGFIGFLLRPSQIMCWLNAWMAACQHARRHSARRAGCRENLKNLTVAQLHKALASRLCGKLHFACENFCFYFCTNLNFYVSLSVVWHAA